MVRIPQFRNTNVGNALGQAAQIKAARLRNQETQQRVDANDNILKSRKKAAEMRQQIESTPAFIDALESEGLYEQAAEVRSQYLDSRVKAIDVLSSTRGMLNASNYDKFREDMIQSGAMTGDMLPVDYSDEWFRKEKKKQISELKKITRSWSENGITNTQDLITKDGEIVWKGTPFETAANNKQRTGDGGGDGKAKFSYKAADDSAMGRQAERLFGGVYDPVTKQFSGLDPEKAQRVQAVHTRAAQVFSAGRGTVTHAEAVRQAANELRIPIEDPTQQDANDPLGLRTRP